jgi:hypothetical protein
LQFEICEDIAAAGPGGADGIAFVPPYMPFFGTVCKAVEPGTWEIMRVRRGKNSACATAFCGMRVERDLLFELALASLFYLAREHSTKILRKFRIFQQRGKFDFS